jgi:hypothetical protein
VGPDWSTNGVLKASYGGGWIRTSSPLSDVSRRGVVRFADGTSPSAPLVGATTAYSQLPGRSGACPTSVEVVACPVDAFASQEDRRSGVQPATGV